MSRGVVIGIFGASMLACSANAEPISAAYTQPSLDRYMYPFNFSSGTESQSPIFGAILQPGFDDRDAQFIIGFNTSGTIPAGFPAAYYKVRSVKVTVYNAIGDRFVFDPTWDSVRTLYNVTDPQYVRDQDPGKPVELYPVAYRSPMTLANFTETSAFGPQPQPQPGSRYVYAAMLDDAGAPTDVSRQVNDRMEAYPAAIAYCVPAVSAGAKVPQDTALVMEVNLCVQGVRSYIQRSLAAGKLNWSVTSLEPATGGPGGGTGTPTYPSLYTKENAIAQILGFMPSMEVQMVFGDPADFNDDGFRTFEDFDAFVAAFEAGDPLADFNNDCFLDFNDFDAFVAAFEGP
ncbi:MAG: hypothetical protein SFY96_01415 [Planctomycetota bacterium]|nr:hypothetical protein [Planctomycetota bacterium]